MGQAIMGGLADRISVAALRTVDTVRHRIGKAIGSRSARAEGDRGTIHLDYDLAAPPAEVWRALTDPALLERWLFSTDMVAEVGRSFTFRTHAAPGFDGVIRCEVLEVVPERRLVYSWKSGPADTIVHWTLAPAAADRTHLSLAHTGFRPGDGWIYEMLKAGWRDRSGELLRRQVSSP